MHQHPSLDLQPLVNWLANHPAVHWIELAASVKLNNWQGTAIIQSATAAPAAPAALSEDQGTHPLWAAGLTGAGQIIGSGDSGLGAFFQAKHMHNERLDIMPKISSETDLMESAGA